MTPRATVAIPTLNAGVRLRDVLRAVVDQRVDRPVELLICDSGSTDGTVALARAHGARVLEIAPGSFSHGGTRNLLMAEAHGDHVALLTQDAQPASPNWLAALLSAFSVRPDVGLAFGPYLPVPGASPSVVRELVDWFASFSPTGMRRIDILAPAERDLPARELLGHRGYFTDANGCIARAAWERVPFREIAYAEDHLLAQDMLRAGFAKVFVPDAAVVHSHEYSTAEWLRRSFDEARALRNIYGVVPAGQWRDAPRNVRGGVGADLRFISSRSPTRPSMRRFVRALASSGVHHLARTTGAVLGAHARWLPRRARAALSLERRG